MVCFMCSLALWRTVTLQLGGPAAAVLIVSILLMFLIGIVNRNKELVFDDLHGYVCRFFVPISWE